MNRLSFSRRALAVGALAVLILAGCGDGDDNANADADETPTTESADETTTTAGEETGSTDPAAPAGPELTVTPADGLTDGQVVEVSGTGFTPNKALAVSQCSEDNTGPGDCHTAAAAFAQTGPDGTLTAQLTIKAGSIGTGGKVCDASTPCSIGTVDLTNPTGPDMSRTRVTFAG